MKTTKHIAFVCMLQLLFSAAQAQYTYRQHFNESDILEQARTHFLAGNMEKTQLALSNYHGWYYGYTHFMRAAILEEEGKPYQQDLDSIYIKGVWFSEADSATDFFQKHKEMLDIRASKDWDTPSIKRLRNQLDQMTDRDQAARKDGLGVGAEVDIENRRLLDSIIAEIGWPSRLQIKPKGSGPSLILVHQDNMPAQDFDHYYRLAAAKCLKKEESWNVAEGILEYRYQWHGSDLRLVREHPDTLMIGPRSRGLAVRAPNSPASARFRSRGFPRSRALPSAWFLIYNLKPHRFCLSI